MEFILKYFKKRPKPYQRTLPLVYIDTFPSGEKIYTYRIEDLHQISYRHYQTISVIEAYLSAFGQLPFEWERAMKEMKDANMDAIENPKNRAKCLTENIKFIDHFQASVVGIRAQSTALEDEMLCMFFVLEGENELGYSEIDNEKKKKLFANNPSMRAFFLSRLPKVSDFFKTTSRNDIHETLNKLAKVKDMIRSTISSKTKT